MDDPDECQSTSSPQLKHLRGLLELNARQLQVEAVRTGGTVANEDLESLERLARLVSISETAQPPLPRTHWPIIIIFVATLLLMSVLLFTGPQSTEIEMDLHVDELSFALLQRQVLNEPLQISDLGLTGFAQVELPRAENFDARTLLSGRDFDSNIAITALPTGEMTFPELTLPAHSKVVLKKSDLPLQYRFTLPTANVDFKLNVNGPMRFSSIAGESHVLTFLSPKAVVFKPQAKQAAVDLTFRTLPLKISRLPLAVEDLSLLRIDDRRGIDGLPARRVSTILSGTLYLEDLNSRKVSLRPGELIQLDGSRGEIAFLQLKNDISVQFRGRVHQIVSGPADIRRSLMPNWLEWLKARQGLSLLWGSALYLFGLAAGALRWFRGSE